MRKFRFFLAGSVLSLMVLGCGVFATSNVAIAAVDASDPLGAFCTEVGSDKPVCKASEKDKEANQGLLDKEGMFSRVLNLITWLTGILAAIFILVGGFKFVTSGGNSDSVKSAKNMILYACVGIAVVILSNVIIKFVIGLVNKSNA